VGFFVSWLRLASPAVECQVTLRARPSSCGQQTQQFFALINVSRICFSTTGSIVCGWTLLNPGSLSCFQLWYSPASLSYLLWHVLCSVAWLHNGNQQRQDDTWSSRSSLSYVYSSGSINSSRMTHGHQGPPSVNVGGGCAPSRRSIYTTALEDPVSSQRPWLPSIGGIKVKLHIAFTKKKADDRKDLLYVEVPNTKKMEN
jgi:hypothetical protein